MIKTLICRSRKFPLDPKDYPESEAIVRRTCELWANFAKYSNPTPESSSFPRWNSVDKISPYETKFNLNYYEMDNERLVSLVNPDNERIEFWRKVYDEFNNGLLQAKL